MKRSTKWIFAISTCAALSAGAYNGNARTQYSDEAPPVLNQQEISRQGEPSRADLKKHTYAPIYRTQQDIVNRNPAPEFADGTSASVTNEAPTYSESNSWENRDNRTVDNRRLDDRDDDMSIFDNDDEAEGESAAATGATTGAAAGATAAAAGEMSDDQIAHVMKTANDAEIDAAQLAKRRAGNDQVKEFAKTMIDDHKNSNKESKKVLKAADIGKDKNDMSKTMKNDAKAKMNEMKKLKGDEFDKAYMNHQIDMHTKMLADLDQKFIPAAKKPELKQFLQTTRTHIEQHLARAQEIVKALPAQ